ncbi:DNA photolyase family protein [Pseudoalteromonas sp. DL2-H2.2]|uniref:cryptochrome/deoxyribodipyrimidine photo-lyase family protein n=1 Tax=Pseudoalteromonas sp. DL2-H2.2 TaxID=2908889 RepID=UPI001F42E699|nr:deoxyribodipyrimidine photo-lyase [Pseudoalteromonas sp. DL2-H2.2]MCF2909496.1 DNA photolyase family protein [Pseudoalteromonas sp. DL2-H2.2]
MSVALVWLKRDLRLSDHEPLCRAVASGHPVLLLYCFEPMLLEDPHYSPRHWQFVLQSLQDIQARVPHAALWVCEQSALQTLQQIHADHQIAGLYSHQEIGLANTFERDKAVAAWCREEGIDWLESRSGAVQRGLRQRQSWDKQWQKTMRSVCATPDLSQVNWFTTGKSIGQLHDIQQRFSAPPGNYQPGGESQAQRVLDEFYQGRGKGYSYSLSSPLLSQQACSRMSAYLAWGNISLRQVYQSVLAHSQMVGWRRTLVAFSSRLHWHCHFIQKFESECEMQFRHINRGYEPLPRCTGDEAKRRLHAWETGNTGIPMVDACMKCLLETGYINFRMRAMLVSFLCHHLELDWRAGVAHLARLFLDFEPGIHYSQFQMQAGVTGINTIRIYNPVKQGEEKDPDGEFVKTWLPALRDIPSPLVHQPWALSPMEQLMYGIELGKDYPEPIVDLKLSYKAAQELLWQWRKKPQVKKEAQRILKRHVRPS